MQVTELVLPTLQIRDIYWVLLMALVIIFALERPSSFCSSPNVIRSRFQHLCLHRTNVGALVWLLFFTSVTRKV